jgi:hypothetical protein
MYAQLPIDSFFFMVSPWWIAEFGAIFVAKCVQSDRLAQPHLKRKPKPEFGQSRCRVRPIILMSQQASVTQIS